MCRPGRDVLELPDDGYGGPSRLRLQVLTLLDPYTRNKIWVVKSLRFELISFAVKYNILGYHGPKSSYPNGDLESGTIQKHLEHQESKTPSDLFLCL